MKEQVLRENGGQLRTKTRIYIDTDLNSAFLWLPQPSAKAVGLKPLGDITTFHHFNESEFFKPTVAEVLSQNPPDYLNTAIQLSLLKLLKGLCPLPV